MTLKKRFLLGKRQHLEGSCVKNRSVLYIDFLKLKYSHFKYGGRSVSLHNRKEFHLIFFATAVYSTWSCVMMESRQRRRGAWLEGLVEERAVTSRPRNWGSARPRNSWPAAEPPPPRQISSSTLSMQRTIFNTCTQFLNKSCRYTDNKNSAAVEPNSTTEIQIYLARTHTPQWGL